MINNLIRSIIFVLINFSFFISLAFSSPSVAFYFSNNSQIISVKKAYERLLGQEQYELIQNAIDILQREHIEQGKLRDSLGVYTLSSNRKITADNSEIFFTSPLQKISKFKVFHVATNLANKFNQESVAVFIPNSSKSIADVKLIFTKIKPSINEAIELIKVRLPGSYSKAFTLNIAKTYRGYYLAEVDSIEWLGNDFDISLIENTFPSDKLIFKRGESYLIFKDGKHQKLV